MTNEVVILGRLLGAHGVHGWCKLVSHTRPVENILQFKHWQLMHETKPQREVVVVKHQFQSNKILVKLDCVDDRSTAQMLTGMNIAVDESHLPVLADTYYWRDLIAMTVKDAQGLELGEVVDLMETGSNDVLLIKDSHGKSLAIPWLPEVVLEVDLSQSIIIVDWEPLI